MSFERFEPSPHEMAKKEQFRRFELENQPADGTEVWNPNENQNPPEKKDPEGENSNPQAIIGASLKYATALEAQNRLNENKNKPKLDELLKQAWLWTQINSPTSSDAAKSANVEWVNWETLSA